LATFLSVLCVGLLIGISLEETHATTPRPTTPTQTSDIFNITLTENPYTFQPDGFDFKVGMTYVLAFDVPGEFHTFTVKELDIDIFINAGESVQEVVAFDQEGTFELVCIPHEALGMVGEVRVGLGPVPPRPTPTDTPTSGPTIEPTVTPRAENSADGYHSGEYRGDSGH
jgi:plastocyanin